LNVEGCDRGNVAMFHRCFKSVPEASVPGEPGGSITSSKGFEAKTIWD
jgi:hypothetical protein